MRRRLLPAVAALAAGFGIVVFAAVAMQLSAIPLKVDHVTVSGRDLKALQSAFDAAGIACEYGGKHSNGLTEMAIASFRDGSYLELIAAQPGSSVANHYWGRFIERDAGACAWAVSVAAIRAAAERLRKSGVEIAPSSSGRQRPDGVPLRWTTASVGPGPQGSFFPFLIEDETPRRLRVYPHGKASASKIEGVALVVIAVRDWEAAIAKWRAAFGLAEPRRQSEASIQAHLAWFADTPVVLASPGRPESPVAARLSEFGEAPFAFILRGDELPQGARSTWFGQTVAWFDPAKLNGARIGVWRGAGAKRND